MIPKNRVVSPWLRAAMNHEQGLEASGYYRKRSAREMGSITFTLWSLVIIAAVLALILTGHHETEMTQGVDRAEVISRWEENTAGWWAARELWILREAQQSSRHLDALHQEARR